MTDTLSAHVHKLEVGLSESTQALCHGCHKAWRGQDARRESLATIEAHETTIRELKAALRTQEAAWKELAGIAARATPAVPGFVVHQIATAGQLACNAALTSTEARG